MALVWFEAWRGEIVSQIINGFEQIICSIFSSFVTTPCWHIFHNDVTSLSVRESLCGPHSAAPFTRMVCPQEEVVQAELPVTRDVEIETLTRGATCNLNAVSFTHIVSHVHGLKTHLTCTYARETQLKAIASSIEDTRNLKNLLKPPIIFFSQWFHIFIWRQISLQRPQFWGPSRLFSHRQPHGRSNRCDATSNVHL